jgi:hypothetical protein
VSVTRTTHARRGTHLATTTPDPVLCRKTCGRRVIHAPPGMLTKTTISFPPRKIAQRLARVPIAARTRRTLAEEDFARSKRGHFTQPSPEGSSPLFHHGAPSDERDDQNSNEIRACTACVSTVSVSISAMPTRLGSLNVAVPKFAPLTAMRRYSMPSSIECVSCHDNPILN